LASLRDTQNKATSLKAKRNLDSIHKTKNHHHSELSEVEVLRFLQTARIFAVLKMTG